MALTPIAIPPRPAASTASSLSTTFPTEIHDRFWDQTAGKDTGFFKKRSLLATSASSSNEKLAPKDYFFSFLPILAHLNPTHTETLRPKVHFSNKITTAEKTAVEKNDMCACKTDREKYIKYKLEKQILLDDIRATLPERRKEFIKNRILDLVASLRLNKSLLTKKLADIDEFSLSKMIDMSPALAKKCLNGDKRKLNNAVINFLKNCPVEFCSALSSIYSSKYNDKIDKTTDAGREKDRLNKTKHNERKEICKLVDEYIQDKKNWDQLIGKILSNYNHVFDEFDSEHGYSWLNRTVFSMLDKQEQLAVIANVKICIRLQIQIDEADLEKIFTTCFSKFSLDDIAQLKTCISNDIALKDQYEFKFKTLDKLTQTMNIHITGIAGSQALPVPEIDLDPFSSESALPASSSGPVGIHAKDEFKHACQLRLAAIAKKWDDDYPQFINKLYYLAQWGPGKLGAELKKLLKPDGNLGFDASDSFIDFDKFDFIIIEDCASFIIENKTSFFFNDVDDWLNRNADRMKSDLGIAHLSTDVSVQMISALVKEQKKHVFERFTNLNAIFEGFVRDANYIIEKAETFKTGAGAEVRDIIISIFKDSDKDEKSETVGRNHHAFYIMGNAKSESDKYSGAEKATTDFLDLLLLPADHMYRKDAVGRLGIGFEHAHTFPFPAVMNWKTETLKKLIFEKGYNVDELHNLNNSKAPFQKDVFIAAKLEIKQEKNTSFQEQINTFISTSMGDTGQFIYVSLNLLSNMYLYLLSETEYLPVCVNKADQISEWVLNESDNYKTHIKESAISMLKINPPNVKSRSLNENFPNYVKNSLLKANKSEEEWHKNVNEEKDNVIIYKLMQIFCLQMRQAAIVATSSEKMIK